jgi:hypothetical protein
MRIIATFFACLFGTAALAQESVGPDGFSICPIVNADIGKCEALSDAALQGYGLTSDEQSIVGKLRRLAGAPDQAAIDDLAKSFAPVETPVDTPNYRDVWFPDRDAAGNALTSCFACGLHLRFAKDDLMQINYLPEAKFIVIWNRVLMTTPAK